MSIYLRDIPLHEAKECFRSALEEAGLWRALGEECISLDENALGRTLAKTVWARISSPHYHASAMDGFAVNSSSTVGATPGSPIILTRFAYLDTGDSLPEDYDAVIPIENVESLDKDRKITQAIRHPSSIRIRATVTPWSYVRPLGEDIIASQLVLPAGQVLRPVDLGAIAASGHKDVYVTRRPRVSILPTGSELVPLGTELQPGNILEFNSIVLAAQIKEWGGEVTRFPIIKDRFELICERVLEATDDHDLILLNAGSSAGSEDFSSAVVEKLGRLLVHGVAVRPGHPVILGMINRRGITDRQDQSSIIPIVGVPGYPVSAALTGEIFVEPVLAKWLGHEPRSFPIEQAILTRKINSPGGDDDYVRVVIGKVGGNLLATPLARGAGVISSLVRADGILILPRGVQGAEAGEKVDVLVHRKGSELEHSIFCTGSHDMTLDLLAQYLSKYGRRFVSANVGSQAGLVALSRNEAHLAGSHLLDPQTGEYNLSYIDKYLHGVPVNVYGFVEREQGLMVRRGNPLRIQSLKDLFRNDVRYVNRQRGAGTRVLLDCELSKLNLDPNLIQGYILEEYTHLGVAAAVASGRADCGLGIPAAAHSLDLAFIPLFQEQYQLVIPKDFAESNLLVPIFSILFDHDFQKEVLQMPGYGIKDMGILVKES